MATLIAVTAVGLHSTPAHAATQPGEYRPLGARLLGEADVAAEPQAFIRGHPLRAGSWNFVLEETGVAPVYTVDPAEPEMTSGYHAVDAERANIPRLFEVIWLVNNNKIGEKAAEPGVAGQLAATYETAATQLAIWNLASSVPLDATTVPNDAIRQRAVRLRDVALAAVARVMSSQPAGAEVFLPSNNYFVGLDAADVGGDIRHVRFQISVPPGGGAKYILADRPQCFLIQVGGLSGPVLGGIVNHVYPSRRVQASAPPGKLATSPGCDGGTKQLQRLRSGQRSRAALDLTTATVELPRVPFERRIGVSYPLDLNPGLVMLPKGTGPRVILAGKGSVTFSRSFTIHPATLSDASRLLQRALVPRIAFGGYVGWAILVILLLAAGILIGLGNATGSALGTSIAGMTAQLWGRRRTQVSSRTTKRS